METNGDSASSPRGPVHATHIQPSLPLMKVQSLDYEPVNNTKNSLAPIPCPPANIASFSFRQNNSAHKSKQENNSNDAARADPSLARTLKAQTAAEILKDMDKKTAYLLSRIQSPAEVHIQRLEFARQEEDARFYAELNVNTLAEAFPDSMYPSDASADSEAEREEREAEAMELKDEETKLQRGDTDMRSLFEFDVPLKGVRLDDERMKNKAERAQRRRNEKAERKRQTKTSRTSVVEAGRHSFDGPRGRGSQSTDSQAGSTTMLTDASHTQRAKSRSHSDPRERPHSWLRRRRMSTVSSKTSPSSTQGSPSAVYDIYSPWPTVYETSLPSSPLAKEIVSPRKQHQPRHSTIPESAIEGRIEPVSARYNPNLTRPSHESSTGQRPNQDNEQAHGNPVPHKLLTLTTDRFVSLISSLTAQLALTTHACTALGAHALDQQRHVAEIARRLSEMEQRYMEKVSELGEVRRVLTVREGGGAGRYTGIGGIIASADGRRDGTVSVRDQAGRARDIRRTEQVRRQTRTRAKSSDWDTWIAEARNAAPQQEREVEPQQCQERDSSTGDGGTGTSR